MAQTPDIRSAHPSDASRLSAVAHAAKRYWGYDEGLMALWDAELTLTPEFIAGHPVYCAVRDGVVVGFYALSCQASACELEHMWVDPPYIGTGVGAHLFQHAVQTVRSLGRPVLHIVSDPHAEGFYQRMGAQRAGQIPSMPAGRMLPRLTYVTEADHGPGLLEPPASKAPQKSPQRKQNRMNTPIATTAAENHRSIFLTKVRTPAGKAAARLLIESIQTFGGEMSGCPIWVFAVDPASEPCHDLANEQVQVIPLPVPAAIAAYPFGDKALACAHAEAIAPGHVQSLIWLDLECLVVQPPLLFGLGDEFDVALRPVHVPNVGLTPSEPLDAFWRGIYAAVGVEDVALTVESFIGRQPLRAYFNSHGLAARPGLALFGRWYQLFQRLVDDDQFQAAACQDERHQVFLFQALWSALVASSVDPQRIRILPPAYNYPYNLHDRVPHDRRAAALNDLVCFTFEGRTIHPDGVTDVAIREPLQSWLRARAVVPPQVTP